MKRIVIASSLIALAALATGCNRDGTGGTAYNNSGASATSPSSTSAPSATTTTTSTATADTSSPNTAATTTMAPGAAGDATGAMSETLTTGKVKAAIAADTGLKDSDISVTTSNGVVTLAGTVKSQDQVSIATTLAQKQEGVTRVDSQVTVR